MERYSGDVFKCKNNSCTSVPPWGEGEGRRQDGVGSSHLHLRGELLPLTVRFVLVLEIDKFVIKLLRRPQRPG